VVELKEVAMAIRRSVALAVCAGMLISVSAVSSRSEPAKAEPGTMWVLLNHVKADQRASFETFTYERLLPALKKGAASDPLLKKVHAQTRMLVPKEANADGTYTYNWLMDPVVPGADYAYRAILERAYSKQETDAAIALMEGSMAGPQVGYTVSSSGRW
jgi:hypothetical protein